MLLLSIAQGRALDLDADVFGKVTNAEIFHYIKDCLDFDQLIWEFGDDTNPALGSRQLQVSH